MTTSTISPADSAAHYAKLAASDLQRRIRGHRFYPPKAVAAKVPALYGTDDIDAADTVLHLHYFTGPADWYVAEMDVTDGRCFGYVHFAGSDGEWGYFSLPEMEALPPAGTVPNGDGSFTLRWVIERDCHWAPITFGALS